MNKRFDTQLKTGTESPLVSYPVSQDTQVGVQTGQTLITPVTVSYIETYIFCCQ